MRVRIKKLFETHYKLYGYRRITYGLHLDDVNVNHKKVLRLMRSMGLKAIRPKRRYNSYGGVAAGTPVDNILNRQFNVDAPYERFVTDVTEFRFKGQKYYLSVLLDLFNKEVITYTLVKRPRYSMVKDMLDQALPKIQQGKQSMLHSDQGWHYRMSDFKEALKNAHIQQSMSRKANCWDNAAMESFFATFKNEFFSRFEGETEESLTAEISEYMHYYNEKRIRLDLKMSPVQYRLKYENNCVNAVQ